MTDSQIITFLTVADEGSIAKAAEALYVSSPSVSKQISVLERDLGLRLFDRTGMGLVLSPGGKLLYEYFTQMFTEYNRVLERARMINDQNASELRVGCREDWNISGFFPEAKEAFGNAFPKSKVSLVFQREHELISGLLNGELDLIITVKENIANSMDVEKWDLATMYHGLLLPANHPLVQKQDLCLRDFRDEVFFVVSWGKHSLAEKNMVDEIRINCEAEGFTPKIIPVPSVISAYSMIMSHQGIMVVSEWSMSRYNPSYRFVDLNKMKVHICACWKQGKKDRLIEKMCQLLSEKIQK